MLWSFIHLMGGEQPVVSLCAVCTLGLVQGENKRTRLFSSDVGLLINVLYLITERGNLNSEK